MLKVHFPQLIDSEYSQEVVTKYFYLYILFSRKNSIHIRLRKVKPETIHYFYIL